VCVGSRAAETNVWEDDDKPWPQRFARLEKSKPMRLCTRFCSCGVGVWVMQNGNNTYLAHSLTGVGRGGSARAIFWDAAWRRNSIAREGGRQVRVSWSRERIATRVRESCMGRVPGWWWWSWWSPRLFLHEPRALSRTSGGMVVWWRAAGDEQIVWLAKTVRKKGGSKTRSQARGDVLGEVCCVSAAPAAVRVELRVC
jgi:hypothetical protein